LRIFLIYITLQFCLVDSQAQNINFSPRFVNLDGNTFGKSARIKKITYTTSSTNPNFTLSINSPFLMSKDSVFFSDSLKITSTNGSIFIKAAIQHLDTIYKGIIKAVTLNKDTDDNKVLAIAHSFDPDSVYSIVSWNVLWMGDADNCNCDPALQQNNISTFLKELQPGICLLQEVVKENEIPTIAAAMGNNFKSVTSNFGSFADNTNDPDYAECQKLSYIYDSNLLNLKYSYAFSKSVNQNIYDTDYYFSSGRYPFVASFTMKTNNTPIDFFNIHAKAGTNNSDFQRRLLAAGIMRDSNTIFYQNTPLLIMGDYNDLLEGSISSNSFSPYSFMQNASMKGISLPSKYPNLRSYAWNPGIIDNICANTSAMKNFTGAFTVFQEIESAIEDYRYTTSDHYPIYGLWKKDYSIPVNITKNESLISFWNDGKTFHIENEHQKLLQIKIYNITGQLIEKTETRSVFNKQKNNFVDLILVEIIQDGKRQVVKW
jgi:trimeric autotransporter adhesin